MITTSTLNRAFTGVAKGESFAEYGANYRADQNSRSLLHAIVNWIANTVSLGHYKTNTEIEIHAKSERLQENFSIIAVALLKLDSKNSEIPVEGEINGKNFTIKSDEHGVITISEGEHSVVLQQNLPKLKRSMLEQYLAIQRKDNRDAAISLRGFNLADTNLKKLDLRNCDFSGAHLERADFSQCDSLRGAQFVGAHAEHANFNQADITGANFSDAQLNHADLSSAWMTGAKFIGTNLTEADLTDAKAREANFTGATLTNAKIHGIKAPNANFTDAIFGAQMECNDADLTNAKYGKNTFDTVTFRNTMLVGKEELAEINRRLDFGLPERRVFFDLHGIATKHCLALEDFEARINGEGVDRGGRIPREDIERMTRDGAARQYIAQKAREGNLDPEIRGALVRIFLRTNAPLRAQLLSLKIDWPLSAAAVGAQLKTAVPDEFDSGPIPEPGDDEGIPPDPSVVGEPLPEGVEDLDNGDVRGQLYLMVIDANVGLLTACLTEVIQENPVVQVEEAGQPA